MIQAVCIPWLWFVGLQQWDEPNFGADEESNGFPRWACALLSSGMVVLVSTLISESWKTHPENFPKFQFSGRDADRISGKLIHFFRNFNFLAPK